jgi:hypothetical protein
VFLSQNRGQNCITVAKPDHPIVFGRMPIGQAVLGQAPSLGPEPLFVTKSATRLISLNFVAALAKKPEKAAEIVACNG